MVAILGAGPIIIDIYRTAVITIQVAGEQRKIGIPVALVARGFVPEEAAIDRDTIL